MKKLRMALCAVVGSASLLLSGCAFLPGAFTGEVKGVVNEELIAKSESAQYLPSRELLVANDGASTASTYSTRSGNVSPQILLDGGLTEEEYEALIENISPIDTPFNRSFTVADAKAEVTKVLSAGVVFDEWFRYREGELSGQGTYFVTNENDVLTVTRKSSFQPWIYDAETNTFPSNDDFTSDIPNYPIRSDNYLKISIYTKDGKEVVECEVEENLSYYGEVSRASYQYMCNVKDTSFTKIQTEARTEIRHPEGGGAWGYDVNTDLPYGYMRSFTQLDYSNPNDIKWLNATQQLPYAFNLRNSYTIDFGSRSAEGGFYYSVSSCFDFGQFSYQPNEEYLTADTDKSIYMSLIAKLDNSIYDKSFQIYEGADDYFVNADSLTEEEQSAYNAQIISVLVSLNALAKNTTIPSAITSFDCTAENTTFEDSLAAYLNAAVKVAIDGSDLAQNYLDNRVYELDTKYIIPA